MNPLQLRDDVKALDDLRRPSQSQKEGELSQLELRAKLGSDTFIRPAPVGTPVGLSLLGKRL